MQLLEKDATAIPDVAREVCRILDRAGKKGWIVGGCVRDLLMGRAVSDWDIATNALPDEVVKIFRHVIPTGLQHGTVTVLLPDAHGKRWSFEVTTLRGEGAYTDGRRPDAVEYVTDIERDLARRDFTVNAIAIDLETLALIDPYDGLRDLETKQLRAVGRAIDRFSEDGLRILRGARFAATLGFEIEAETLEAMPKTLDTFRKVSQERVRDEWLKLMKAKKPSRGFDIMRETGMMAVTCPELLEGYGMAQNKWHGFDVWRHGMECLDACKGDPILRMGALLHDVGKPRTRAWSEKTSDYTFYHHEVVGAEIAEPIVTRLRFSNDEKARICHLVRHHLFHYTDDWSDAAVRRWIKKVSPERLADLYALNEADLRAKGREDPANDLIPLAKLKSRVESVLAKGAALSIRSLKVDGKDLMRDLGMKPGRQIGIVLESLLEAVLESPELNTRETLLERARDMLEKGGV